MFTEVEYLMTPICVSFGPMSKLYTTSVTKFLINLKPGNPILPDESRRKTRSIPLTRQATCGENATLST